MVYLLFILKNSVFFSFSSQKYYKQSFLVKLGKLWKSVFLIKSNFSDHIHISLLTQSLFLSQYEWYLLKIFSRMSTFHLYKLASFMYLNIFWTGDPIRLSHSGNVSGSIVCACNSLEWSRMGYCKNNENKLKNTYLTDINFVSGKYWFH